MAASEARLKANKKYHDRFDNIQIRVPKGKKMLIQAYASQRGESVNAFLNRAVDETMERDSRKEE